VSCWALSSAAAPPGQDGAGMRAPPMGVDELIEHWTVLPDERELVAGKRGDPGACANLGK
jgi:hypothetical protein